MRPSPTKRMTILMTGGHVTPAIATIEEIRSRSLVWRIVFVGRLRALEGEKAISEEYRLMRDLRIPFVPIVAGRLKREGGVGALFALAKVPIGFFQAIGIIRRERPSVVVSFGGYVALPVALAARVFGVPIITHEQTTRPGVANRLISRIASVVCVTFADTAALFPKSQRVEVTGLPVRKEIFLPPRTCPFRLSMNKPILLIVGGSTGSVSVNNVLFQALPRLLDTYVVIHQVGRVSEAKSREVLRTLQPRMRERYIVRVYLSASEYSWALHHANIVIGRSGANTVMELLLSAAVAILIPLPWAADNEQFHNARRLLSGGSEIVSQDTLSDTTLISTIKRMMTNWEERKALAQRLAATMPNNGAERLVGVIERVVGAS